MTQPGAQKQRKGEAKGLPEFLKRRAGQAELPEGEGPGGPEWGQAYSLGTGALQAAVEAESRPREDPSPRSAGQVSPGERDNS